MQKTEELRDVPGAALLHLGAGAEPGPRLPAGRGGRAHPHLRNHRPQPRQVHPVYTAVRAGVRHQGCLHRASHQG